MRLTNFSDYALRVLLYAAAHDDRVSTIAEIQDYFHVSGDDLTEVVQFLASEGYLEVKRGRADGIRLGRPVEQINLGKLIRLTEPDFRLVECFGGNNNCIISRFCRLPGPLNHALEAFMEALDSHTLADMMLADKRFAQRPDGSKLPERGPAIKVSPLG